MRRRRLLIFGACFVAIAVVAAVVLNKGGHVIDIALLRVQGFPDGSVNHDGHPCLVLRLTKPDAPYIEIAEDQEVQFRIAGKWLAPEKLDGTRLVMVQSLPGCGLVGVIPNRRGAEAFRLHLTWRRQSPRDEAEGWLVDHANSGWKIPRVCFRLCTKLPKERRWRHTVVEMELPKEPWWSAPGYEPHEPPHNESRQPTPVERSGSFSASVARRGCVLRWALLQWL
jgi:hypothetical protein